MTRVRTRVVTEVKAEPGRAAGPERGPKRGFLEHVYLDCSHSCPDDRKYDNYGLPIPKLEEAHDGIQYSFNSQDVWCCYAPGFLDWEKYEDMYDTSRKVKQVAATSQFWDRPPGAMTTPKLVEDVNT